MCTVSFVSHHGKTIITSNRDERTTRPTLEPLQYELNNKTIYFPKDVQAGGTWYAVDSNSNVIVLLNGAQEKHIRCEHYRKSRGLVVLELIGSASVMETWETIELYGIEPFTLVVFEDGKLFQLQWDGNEKESLHLDENEHHIWSSTTLYPKEIREHRDQLFNTFMKAHPNAAETELLNFHRYTEDKNSQNGLVINRNEILRTLSITQTVVEAGSAVLKHFDLVHDREFVTPIVSP